MLPKTSHPQVSKQVRVLGKPYESLGFVFKEALDKELDARRLEEEIQAGQRKWAEVCRDARSTQPMHEECTNGSAGLQH